MNHSNDFLLQQLQRFLDYYVERDCELSREIEVLEKRLEIYEKALRIYGNPENYGDGGEFWHIVIDGGKIARKAIEEAKKHGKEKEPAITKEVVGGI